MDENTKPLRGPPYEIFKYENPRASAPLQEPSCEEYTYSEYPHESETPKRVQCTKDTIFTPSREMYPTKSYAGTREMRNEPFSEEESSQDEHSEGTRMVLLPSTFPVFRRTPTVRVSPTTRPAVTLEYANETRSPPSEELHRATRPCLTPD